MMTHWTWDWALRNFIAECFMPPGLWIITGLVAFFLLKKRPCLRATLVSVSFLLIWVTATPWFKSKLVDLAEPWMNWLPSTRISSLPRCEAQAVVVLGGGRRLGVVDAPHYRYQDLSSGSLERVRAAAMLAKDKNLPILVTGGAPDKYSEQDLPEATVMAWVLEREYDLKTRWQETASQTTQENAQLSAALLKQEGVTCVMAVTHYWHMPRALLAFEKVGLQVLPHSIAYHSESTTNPLTYYPGALKEVREIWHEILGAMWYRWRY